MASTRSSAKFTINGTASSPPGFAAAHSAVLELQLETQPPLDTFSCTYSIAAIAPTGGDTATLSNGGVADPPGEIVECTIPGPGAGMVAYLLRCQTNGGELTRDAEGNLTAAQNTYERIVVVFGFTAGIRVMIVGESTEYSAGGWCDLINAIAQAVEDLAVAAAAGIDNKRVARGASLANQTLTGPLTEDGIVYDDDDRYLAKDQADLTENGLYAVNTGGAWTRTTDANTDELMTSGLFVMVSDEGTVNGASGWAMLKPGSIAIGSDDIVFTKIFGKISTAAPLPPAVAAVAGVSKTDSPNDHVHPWGTATAALNLRRPQHLTGAGISDSIRGQAAKAGAYVGGDQVLGGGDAGNGTVKAGRTVIVLGAAPTGSVSAELNVCASDGGAKYLGLVYDDTKARVVLSSATTPYLEPGLRVEGTVSHVPVDLTSAATITMTEGKGNHRNVVLVHNTDFAAPTGFENGTELVLFVEQGAGAPWTATFNAAFVFATGMSSALVGNDVGEVDMYRFILRVDQWFCVAHESY